MHADGVEITPSVFTPFLSVLSIASMIYGAVVAITQEDIKRMLAYSSIAHAGYMLIGLATLSFSGANAVTFYLIAYTFMNMGAFGIIAIFENKEGKFLSFSDYAGMGSRNPVQAAILSIFLFALAGLPPFAGFFAKYFIFISAIKNGQLWLAIFGIISSIISAYFYLRLIVIMYFQKTEAVGERLPVSNISMVGVLVSLFIFLAMSIFPGTLEGMISGFLGLTF
ncbi:MAG: hypothetical protein HYV28_20315 [Ignavibacteriales bacterium]|nr:hypothetical protein [Ignavibacteriales bacterium]